MTFSPVLAVPTATTRRLPRDDDERLYLRAYLGMRAMIGIIGILTPIVLLVADHFFLKGTALAKGSLSAYYYSGVRDVFVGSLWTTAIFLITYRVFERDWENLLSAVSGVAALGVAMFSTDRPPGGSIPLSPLQAKLGESAVAFIHFSCAIVFILSLAAISMLFGRREGERGRERNGHVAKTPMFWRRFHRLCAGAIVAAVVFIAVTARLDLVDHRLLYGEVVAVWAFGASWLAKGLELTALFGREAEG